MRTEFDGAAYSLYLLRYYDHYWGGAETEPDDWSLEMEEESADEAIARMTDDEKTVDEQWERSQNAHSN